MPNLEQLTENGLEDVCEADFFELQGPTGPVPYAIDVRNQVYLSADLHPGGAPDAMSRATEAGIPWIAKSAVEAFFPAEWLVAEAMGEPVRSSIIPALVAAIRNRG